MDNKSITIDSYNQHASEYTTEANSRGARISDIELIFKLINKDNPFIVELGCGNGRDAKEFVKRTTNYLGMDGSVGLIEEAKKMLPEVNFVCSDFDNFVFPEKTDSIVAFASLLHASKETMEEVLQKSFLSLNPNGIIFLSLQQGEYQEINKEDNMGTRTFYLYNSKLLKELAPEGFESVYEDTQEVRGKKWLTLVLKKVE